MITTEAERDPTNPGDVILTIEDSEEDGLGDIYYLTRTGARLLARQLLEIVGGDVDCLPREEEADAETRERECPSDSEAIF